jgi:hypothetical protein
VEYLAYFSVEPWPEERADLNNAILATLLANSVPRPKSATRAFEIQDFKIDYWKQAVARQEQSAEKMKANVQQIARTLEKRAAEGTL